MSEGILRKIVGNILWGYPDRRKLPIHVRLESKRSNLFNYQKRRLGQHPDCDRIAWTAATVEAVDSLPFDRWKGEAAKSSTIYLRTYLSEAFGLALPQSDWWAALERLRRIRNDIVHRSLELTILEDWMQDARIYLANYPTPLVQVAAKHFPKACTEEPPDEEDDGTPAYLLQKYF